jgi:hypothetical protein
LPVAVMIAATAAAAAAAAAAVAAAGTGSGKRLQRLQKAPPACTVEVCVLVQRREV